MNNEIVEIVAISSVFGMPVLIALIVGIVYLLNKRSMYNVIKTMVENGHPVPPQMFERQEKGISSIGMLRNGLMCIAVGVGTALLAWAVGSLELASVASVPALVGVAYVIISVVAKKKEEAEAAKAPESTTPDC